MFAPKVARPQEKAAADLTYGLAHQRSTLTTNQFGYGPVEQARFPEPTFASQAALRQEAEPEGMTAREAPRRAAWNFCRVPVFDPDRPNRADAHPIPHGIQPKLAVGEIDDPLEREADAVADQVMRKPDPGLSVSAASPQVSRKCAKCEEEDEQTLRRKETARGFETAGTAPSAIHETLSAPGQPLDPVARGFFEPRFGRDLSNVQLHTDVTAAAAADAIGAHAFTYKNHIAFAAGRYAPESDEGRHLLAHELAHVEQQLLSASGPLIQRQESLVHKPQKDPTASVPSEKWRSDVEANLRRAGFNDEADAVLYCREWGICSKILTQKEAYEAYRKGRIEAKLGEPPPERAKSPSPASSTPVAAGLAAPALTGGGTAAAESAVAKTALERAAVQWGTAGVESGLAAETAGATAAEAGLAAETAGATAAGASVATVAVPIAVGVLVILAVVDLIGYAEFQRALKRLGYVVLPDLLGVCIGLCHTSPARPAPLGPFPEFRALPRFGSPQPIPPFGSPQPISPEERKRIEDWLTPPEAAKPRPAPKQQPTPRQAPDPRSIPEPEEPRKGCTCICRADADENMPGNIKPGMPRFAFGTATAGNCAEASKAAKRAATQSLGMKPKHIGCRCAGS